MRCPCCDTPLSLRTTAIPLRRHCRCGACGIDLERAAPLACHLGAILLGWLALHLTTEALCGLRVTASPLSGLTCALLAPWVGLPLFLPLLSFLRRPVLRDLPSRL